MVAVAGLDGLVGGAVVDGWIGGIGGGVMVV